MTFLIALNIIASILLLASVLVFTILFLKKSSLGTAHEKLLLFDSIASVGFASLWLSLLAFSGGVFVNVYLVVLASILAIKIMLWIIRITMITKPRVRKSDRI